MVQSIYARDYPVLQAAVVLIALIFVFVNLFVDISYAYLDPQIGCNSHIVFAIMEQ